MMSAFERSSFQKTSRPNGTIFTVKAAYRSLTRRPIAGLSVRGRAARLRRAVANRDLLRAVVVRRTKNKVRSRRILVVCRAPAKVRAKTDLPTLALARQPFLGEGLAILSCGYYLTKVSMETDHIRCVRSFNRTVTQRIGALNNSFLDRGRPLGEARLLYEIGPDGRDVSVLREKLALDSGYLSRLLRSLERQGLVRTRRGAGQAAVGMWSPRERASMNWKSTGAARMVLSNPCCCR